MVAAATIGVVNERVPEDCIVTHFPAGLPVGNSCSRDTDERLSDSSREKEVHRTLTVIFS
jgi:hypothetical protein